MAKSINKVILIGYMGSDIDVKYTQNGTAVGNFSLATNTRRKDSDGNLIENTEWHRVVVWDKMAEIVNQYMSKGTLVYVEGKLQTRKWTDNNGVDRYTTEVVAYVVNNLSSRNNSKDDEYQAQPSQPQQNQNQPSQPQQNQNTSYNAGISTPAPGTDSPFDDDIPF